MKMSFRELLPYASASQATSEAELSGGVFSQEQPCQCLDSNGSGITYFQSLFPSLVLRDVLCMVRPAFHVCCPFLGLGMWLLALWISSQLGWLPLRPLSCAERWLCSLCSQEICSFPRSWFLGLVLPHFLLPGCCF